MQNIVEEVEYESQTEGSPANSQHYKDMGRCEVLCSSVVGLHQSHRKSHRCQAERDDLTNEINILTRLI